MNPTTMASSTKSNGSIPSNGRSGTTKKDKVEERTAPFSLPPAYDLHRSDRINGGDTTEDLLKAFPDLEPEDIQACLTFAAKSLNLNSVHLAVA